MFNTMIKYARATKAGLVAGYQAIKEDVAAGYAHPTEEEFKTAQKVAGRCNEYVSAKGRKVHKAMFGGKIKVAKYAALKTIATYSKKDMSAGYKFGMWCARPISSTVTMIKNVFATVCGFYTSKSTTTLHKVLVTCGILKAISLISVAIYVMGFAAFATTVATAVMSIGFSRVVFIRFGIAWYWEALVDVTIFVAYTMYLLS